MFTCKSFPFYLLVCTLLPVFNPGSNNELCSLTCFQILTIFNPIVTSKLCALANPFNFTYLFAHFFLCSSLVQHNSSMLLTYLHTASCVQPICDEAPVRCTAGIGDVQDPGTFTWKNRITKRKIYLAFA